MRQRRTAQAPGRKPTTAQDLTRPRVGLGTGRPLSKVQGEEEFVEPGTTGQGEEEQRMAVRSSDRVRRVRIR